MKDNPYALSEIMARVRRTGGQNRIIVRNSKVYASYTSGAMGALFALHSLRKGEIIVQYTGPLLSKKAADESSSQHLMTAYKQSRKGADTVVRTVIDGRGQLAGFANYAPWRHANAFALDILPTLLRMSTRQPSPTALVLVAKRDIPAGQEIRFDYDKGTRRSEFYEMMRAAGVGEGALTSSAYLGTTWITPPHPPNHAGMVEDDYPIDSLHALGIDVDRVLREISR